MKKILIIFFAVLYFAPQLFAQIPIDVSVKIVRAEDKRRFDKVLEDLMKSANEKIRVRAALAAGRIGDERAVPTLVNLLENDSTAVRAMAAFALGEIESAKAADAILKILNDTKNADPVRAKAIEAAGKIAAANAKDEKSKILGEAILDALEFEDTRGAKQNRDVILLGLTAILRVRPEEGDFVAAKFLTNMDARIRTDAANALARIRAKNANEQLRAMLLSDDEPTARANAARALGAAEDKNAFNLLLDAALTDDDSRVRISAIRALANLKDAKAADKLLERGENLLTNYKKSKFANPFEKNELLEIATALGKILPNSNNEKATNFLTKLQQSGKYSSPETEIAFANIAPEKYLADLSENLSEKNFGLLDWRVASSRTQALAILANQQNEQMKNGALVLYNGYFNQLEDRVKPNIQKEIIKALPDIIRSFANFKTSILVEVLINLLQQSDIFVRATAAELLGEQPATKENIEALKTAFAQALQKDKDYNDAQLAILSALVKLDKTEAVSSLKLALDAPDFLIRRHAAELIKQNDLTKGFPNASGKVGTVNPYNPKTGTKLGQILNSQADYVRAVSRRNARAIITTEKGNFTIEFAPADAPLTVDNFIKLARSGYFNSVAVHRVVPNFVVQDGDPRGDGNGGPGWQIRDEINMLPFERGAVGMALSGKDTGGSQWFVTHSPQPHLDGGYTVFGKVNETDMKIVETIARGDKILRVKIIEDSLPQRTRRKRREIKQ